MTPMGASWSGQTSKVRCPLGNQVEPWSGQDPRSAPRHLLSTYHAVAVQPLGARSTTSFAVGAGVAAGKAC
ncbi:MAG: hypothetical protein BRC48_03990 [Cyanobacteria bacterium QS_9_48_30]|nr:MAG: hypothetical protein BRC48_03990 [Cyanobacteria bacterium QS_9_48_30]